MSEERWLTYAELGQELGISVEAARSLVRRHKWPRRIPNEYGTPARVLVPADRLRPTVDPPVNRPTQETDPPLNPLLTTTDPGSTGDRPENEPEPVGQMVDQAVVFQQVFEIFRLDLTASRDRAEQAERRADELKATFDLKEGRYQEIIAQLTDEVSEQRRVTTLLVEQMAARRRWWPWRR